MRIEIEFSAVQRLVHKMGARLSSWKPKGPSLNPREQIREELKEGKEIPLKDVEASFGELLTYKGEQVVLYIKDTRLDRDTLLHDLENSRRFHIAECRTLNDMRNAGRFERYVVTTRRDGRFLVEATDPVTRETEELETKLLVCKNCLSTLDWKTYTFLSKSEKNAVWDEFSLDDFFFEFATFFHARPRYSDQTAPRGGYARDWSRIARERKEQRKWVCDGCGVNLSENKRLLHVHHTNGVVSDNSSRNLAVLCVLCHSEQPAHQWLKPGTRDRILIQRLRHEQGRRTN